MQQNVGVGAMLIVGSRSKFVNLLGLRSSYLSIVKESNEYLY